MKRLLTRLTVVSSAYLLCSCGRCSERSDWFVRKWIRIWWYYSTSRMCSYDCRQYRPTTMPKNDSL